MNWAVNVCTVLSEGQLRTEEKRKKEIEIDRDGNVIATLGFAYNYWLFG